MGVAHNDMMTKVNLRIFYGIILLMVLLDFSLTIKAAPHECVIRTSQP